MALQGPSFIFHRSDLGVIVFSLTAPFFLSLLFLFRQLVASRLESLNLLLELLMVFFCFLVGLLELLILLLVVLENLGHLLLFLLFDQRLLCIDLNLLS